jgi:ribonuclease HI
MARLNWSRARSWKPAEHAFPVDLLAQRARAAERAWMQDPASRSPRQEQTAEGGGLVSFDVRRRERPTIFSPEACNGPTLREPGEVAALLAGATLAHVFCDGSASPNPGPIGWGAIINVDGRNVELHGGGVHGTNNFAELTGAIAAIEALPANCVVIVGSDSQYLINGMTKWLKSWRRKEFRRHGQRIPNASLWERLAQLNDRQPIAWHWVRGHSGIVGNIRADRLAAQGSRQ